MGLDRDYAVTLCEWYFPTANTLYPMGNVGMDHICKDYGFQGTTCGYLVHWLLWKLGCYDAGLVNRYEPDTGTKYVSGKNLSRVSGHPGYRAFVPGNSTHANGFKSGTRRPKKGDPLIIDGVDFVDAGGVPYDSAHILVLLDNGTMNAAGDSITYKTCETGKTNAAGKQSGRRMSRTFKLTNGKWVAQGENLNQGVVRHIAGWLDLDALPFTAYPDIGEYEMLATYAAYSSSGPPVATAAKGVWYVTSPEYPPGWYYLLFPGYRLAYTLGSRPNMIEGCGYWCPDTGDIYLGWATGYAHQEWMTLGPVPGTATGYDYNGSPFAAVKVPVAAAVLNSFVGGIGQNVGPKK